MSDDNDTTPGDGSDGNTAATRMAGWRNVALCLWFALVLVAFWGSSLGMPAPVTALFTPLYGMFLLVVVAVAALDFLRRRETDECSRPAGPLSTPRERQPRHGR